MKQVTLLLGLILMLSTGIQAQNQNQPCACCSENYRQFDFWLGEWSVTQNGNPAGDNSIHLVQDSCVILEKWTSAQGSYTGTSYSFYERNTGKWKQIWVDNQGGYLDLAGSFEGNQMVLYSDREIESGKPIHRVTWTNNSDGSVRQLWETSTDDEATWAVSFDGLYVKKD